MMRETEGKIILVVEDKESERFLLDILLKEAGFKSLLSSNGKEALELLGNNAVDLILSDMVMPQIDGMDLLNRVKEMYPGIPFIMMTAHGSIEKAVASIKYGAFDYIQKPYNPDDLIATIMRALDFHRMSEENRKLKAHLHGLYSFQNIVTKSPLMIKALKMAEKVSKTPHTTIMIYGENGTGKEVMARAIHVNGKQIENRFVAVNCAGIPHALLESEIFGYVKGAFTGAERDREGKFELAQGGTLLLDEIGDMPFALQAKFLRVLQERTYERLGSNKQIKANCRVVVATHRNLEEMVKQEKFREDLYHRINTFPIIIPPLRERREDIPLLANHFLEHLRLELGKQLPGFSQKAMDILCSYDWPGNIRELKNCIERAAIITEDELIRLEHLSLTGAPSFTNTAKDGSFISDNHDVLHINFSLAPDELSLNAITERVLRMFLERCNNNKSRAAELLKVDRRMFYRIK